MVKSENQDKAFPEDGLDMLAPGTKDRVTILFRIGEELEKESDRGCALVAAAYLENEISELLERSLIELGSKVKKALFEFNGPMGTFSSKIKLAFALGLISKEIQIALDIVRKLRNEFAHLHIPLDFESNNIKQRVVNLLPNLDTHELTTRQSFIVKIQSMAASIHLNISCAHRRISPQYEQVPILEDPSEQEIEIAARKLMKITTPEITYKEAIEVAKRFREIKDAYRDREAPHSAPLPHHAAYGSVLRGSADQAGSDPGEQKPK